MSDIRYSIKDLEHFTKIKAHTIRIWEQRYGLLTPKRTETNIRYYSEEDLKKILNINLLYLNGYKISRIAALNEDEIISHARTIILDGKTDFQSEIDEIIVHILAFNEKEIRDILYREMEKVNVDELYMKIVMPVLHKIGELWQVNTIEIIHEHFFSNIFRTFMICRIDELESTHDSLRKAVLFLHDEEEHEFSLLLYYYLLKKNGYYCFYFGQKVPIKNLPFVCEKIRPQIIVTTFVAKLSDKRWESVISLLKDLSKDAQVVMSGSQLINLPEIPKEILQIKSIEQLEQLIQD